MAYTILVAGLLAFDSGKTWLGASLAACASRRGVRVAAFKPVGAFNLWLGYHHFVEGVERYGLLAGGDALTYSKVLNMNPANVNPVALATAFPDPLQLPGASYYLSVVGDLAGTLVLARLPTARGEEHLVAVDNLEKLPPRLRAAVRDAAAKLHARTAESREILALVSSDRVAGLLDESYARISSSSDVVIVESFNDALVPYTGPRLLSSIDLLVVTAPGRALVYSGDRLRRVLEAFPSPRPRTGTLFSALGRPAWAEALPPARSLEEYADSVCETRLGRLLG